MKPADKLRKSFKELHASTSSKLDKKIHEEISRASEYKKNFKALNKWVNIWRIIIESKIVKLSLTAGIIAVILFSLHWFGAPAPAYGITEALELWKNAETVHIKGWTFLHTGDDTQLEKFPFELWFDRKNGQFRDWHPTGWHGDYTTVEPAYSLTVSDGQYIMKTTYRGDQGAVKFTKLTPFQRQLQTRTIEPFPAFMTKPKNVEGFVRIGRERMRNTIADIWEGQILGVGESIPYKKLRIWLQPSTGKIVRVFLWTNAEENAVRWVPLREGHTIEYNATPPADCFKTEAQEGFEQRNTKEKAIVHELGYDGRSRFYGCIGFTLNDGSVIFGWHANHEPKESQAHFFDNLKPGGPLPKVPARIIGLKPWPVEEKITCVGRHLAWTEKKGKFYEWGIYMADQQMPNRNTFQDYKVIREYDGIEPRRFLSAPNRIGEELIIHSEEEFNTWIRGAMAELSDNGKAPDHITYENVLQLTKKIRNSSHVK